MLPILRILPVGGVILAIVILFMALSPRQAKVVEARYFAGMTVEETSEALDLSPATVKREWTAARAWLNRELAP